MPIRAHKILGTQSRRNHGQDREYSHTTVAFPFDPPWKGALHAIEQYALDHQSVHAD